MTQDHSYKRNELTGCVEFLITIIVCVLLGTPLKPRLIHFVLRVPCTMWFDFLFFFSTYLTTLGYIRMIKSSNTLFFFFFFSDLGAQISKHEISFLATIA